MDKISSNNSHPNNLLFLEELLECNNKLVVYLEVMPCTLKACITTNYKHYRNGEYSTETRWIVWTKLTLLTTDKRIWFWCTTTSYFYVWWSCAEHWWNFWSFYHRNRRISWITNERQQAEHWNSYWWRIYGIEYW